MEQIYKYRSFPACIASGYKLYHTNIRTILFKSWVEGVAFGLLFGLLLGAIALRASLWVIVVLVLGLLVATVFWVGRLFHLIDGGEPKRKLVQASKAVLVGIPFTLLPLVGIPLANVILELMLEEKPHPGRALLTGLKHWGYLFYTLFISSIIMLLLALVVSIPLNISLYALYANHTGMATGDPNGLPAAFPLLLVFVGMLTSFVMLFVQVWQTFALAYAHGAIYTRDQRK